MTEAQENLAELRVAQRVRPLVNDILERFNQDHITPEEAGMVILALTHRLLGVLAEFPETRQRFVMSTINLMNNYLSGAPEGMGEMM
jgi:hypothetical protein